jgi:hypothetical protein
MMDGSPGMLRMMMDLQARMEWWSKIRPCGKQERGRSIRKLLEYKEEASSEQEFGLLACVLAIATPWNQRGHHDRFRSP